MDAMVSKGKVRMLIEAKDRPTLVLTSFKYGVKPSKLGLSTQTNLMS